MHFGEAELEGDSMRSQLMSLARQLGSVNAVLTPHSQVPLQDRRQTGSSLTETWSDKETGDSPGSTRRADV